MSLLCSATPGHQRPAAQEFTKRELADTNRRVSTPSRSSTNDDSLTSLSLEC
ncbi:putative polyprotein [Plasmopara halstedii]|uniref:Putative polyprotein n=1 Tax=Plasmopara halstedii TaxID=4781 RepID=A0A0N7L575_PLAHL|nr:putative polyprotein [Plasmopara halstedii]CEG40691.1 putative polyprotein [Plasmopara halstedii]|eukprot:XP_024577060.1 putative polyprotein [Plasmopara halstedii]